MITRPKYYFHCKLGEETTDLTVAPIAWKRNFCMTPFFFYINGNADFQIMGMRQYDGNGIQNKPYILNGKVSGSADYKNATTVDDIFETDSLRTGQLIITSINKPNKIISGTFYFTAYNPVQDKTVNITDGKFRLKYTDY